MSADNVQENHVCLVCGVDISHRSRKALRCEACATNHEKIRSRQSAKDYYWANRTRVLQRIKSYRQTPEAKQVRRGWEERNPEKLLESRQRQKQRHREKTGYNPEGRSCVDCNADISHRGHRAKRCFPCSTPTVRKCKICGSRVGRRGPSEFCSETCRQHDLQLRELEGYTKTCTKCDETKEHTEFGLHYGLRRSTCRSCEVEEQSERYRNFTPEQSSRRRKLRHENERRKKASQSPEERTEQRTKAREALMRKRFGDFDEYAQYVKQGGKCAICGIAKPFKKGATASDCLELDHDHATGMPRGFLCKNCNFKLLPRYERFPVQHQDSSYLNAYLARVHSNEPNDTV